MNLKDVFHDEYLKAFKTKTKADKTLQNINLEREKRNKEKRNEVQTREQENIYKNAQALCSMELQKLTHTYAMLSRISGDPAYKIAHLAFKFISEKTENEYFSH